MAPHASVVLLALLMTNCAGATIKPTAGICDQPAPALAMVGERPQSLHLLVKSACAMVGIKVIPTPRYDSGN